MSLPAFPSSLPGLEWNVVKTPIASTRILTSRSGLEYRVQNWSYGKYKFELSYSVLRAASAYAELQTLLGFCLAQAGQYAPFVYSDPTDNSVTAQPIGTGDGTTTNFALVRALGGTVEPVFYANTISNVYINGVNQASGWTSIQAGRYGTDTIQFASAPALGAAITVTYTYSFVCRFLQDDPEFTNFQNQFWEMKKLQFQTIK